MEKNMREHIEATEQAQERNIQHYEKKIECLEMALSKFSNVSEL